MYVLSRKPIDQFLFFISSMAEDVSHDERRDSESTECSISSERGRLETILLLLDERTTNIGICHSITY